MKPHLPIQLLRTILTLVATVSVVCSSITYAEAIIVVPDGYTSVNINSTNQLKNYTQGNYMYVLGDDIIIASTSYHNYSDYSYIFSSKKDDSTPLYGFTSMNCTTINKPCIAAENCSFNDLNHLYFTKTSILNSTTSQDLSVSVWNRATAVNEALGGISVDSLNISGVEEVINISSTYLRSKAEATAKNTAYGPYGFGGTASATATAKGGFVNATSDIVISDNAASISFTGTTTEANSYAYASASYMYQTAEAEATSKAYAYGGVLYSKNIVLSENTGNISFANNIAKAITDTYVSSYGTEESSEYSAAYGGAIYGTNVLVSNNSGDISFIKNGVSGASVAFGGAIYSTGPVTITGNNDVLFEKNYEKTSTYRLRSIYIARNSTSESLKLGAKSGCSITFNDSVYSGAAVSLNADYDDENGITQKATGDIVFSGKYTEEHLKEIKGGTSGSALEITNSRTSELLNTVNLYGGTLRVEDKAILNTHDINVVADGNATMKVLDATVNAGSYAVNINSTGHLTLGGADGSAQLTAKNININQGATLSAERTEVPEVAPAITLAAEDTVSIFNEKLGGVVSGNLNLAAGAAYKADGAHLSISSGTLTFNSSATDKINLILTLGAEYNEDSKVLLFTDVSTVKFVLDNITATKTGQSITLNAADYFAGEWINENTQLIYEGGNVYLTGVNRVIPEPTTATLSLFALAGLAMRRRRGK